MTCRGAEAQSISSYALAEKLACELTLFSIGGSYLSDSDEHDLSQALIMGKPMTPGQYIDQWSKNSRLFEAQGDYDWMASFQRPCSLLLEIGCGSGRGTAVLAKMVDEVICVEINQDAIGAAQQLLKKAGFPTRVIKEHQLSRLAQRKPGITFVRTSVLDTKLSAALPPLGLDAMACWNMGAAPPHIASSLGKPTSSLELADAEKYREGIEDYCYELGRQLVRPGGLVQFVSRLAPAKGRSDEEVAQNVLQREAGRAGAGYEEVTVALRSIVGGLSASEVKHHSTGGDRSRPLFLSILLERSSSKI